MGSPLNSLSNSPGISIATHLLDSCITILRKAPPLSETGSQSITSLIDIKPQDIPPAPSKFSPYLIAAGVVTLLATAYIVVKVVMHRFYSSKPDNKTPTPQAPSISSKEGSQAVSASGSQPLQPSLSLSLSSSDRPPVSSSSGHPIDSERPLINYEPQAEDVDSSSSEEESPSIQPKVSYSSTVMERIRKAVGGIATSLTSYFNLDHYFPKWMKYRIIQDRFEKFAQDQEIKFYQPPLNSPKPVVEIAAAWNKLVEILTQSVLYPTADEQYTATVTCLRAVIFKLRSADDSIRTQFASQRRFVNQLSSIRFAGIKFFRYCKEIIPLATGKPLPIALSLDTFSEEITTFTDALNQARASMGTSPGSKTINQLKGHFNTNFDPLVKSNVPYVDGELRVNEMATLLLWHGTPVSQHDPWGLAFDVAAGLLKYIPFVRGYLPSTNPLTNPPVVNPDYVAFIEEAAEQKKKILHVVLENGEKKDKIGGDESARVITRLRLGVYHPNFYPLALRLDGHFFERKDIEGPETFENLKTRFKHNLLVKLSPGTSDLSASQLDTKQAEDQLSVSGYCIPKKLREESNLEANIDILLGEVQTIYFNDLKEISSLDQHQAFLLLSYAHIILFICDRMKISILEALCKDDKDRGNVVKTLLKLHFLYLTGTVNHDTLMAVLVNMLARPFIVQKNGIIKSRLALLQRAIPFIAKAYAHTKNPRTFLFGGKIENTSYETFSSEGHSIYPVKNLTRTMEEYHAFLNEHQSILIEPHTNNLIEELASGFRMDDQSQKQVAAQTALALKTVSIWAGESLLSSLSHREGTTHVLLPMINYLQDVCSLSEEASWKILASLNKNFSLKLDNHMQALFSYPLLGISVSLEGPTKSLRVTQEHGKVQLKFETVYSIMDDKGTMKGRVNASMTIKDHMIGHAQFEYAVIKD